METTFLTAKPLSVINNIESEFHERRIVTLNDGSTRDGPHNGMDFACAINTPVKSAHAGTIIRSGYSSSYGNFVIIEDDTTHKGTLYAHLNSFNFDVDSTSPISVVSGQDIAFSGNTPGNVAYHLHFEVLTEEAINKLGTYDYHSTGIGMWSYEHNLRENPRIHLALAFKSELPLGIKTYDGGFDLEDDSRINTLTGNFRANTFTLHQSANTITDTSGGSDTYKFNLVEMGKNTIIDGDGIGNIIIDTGTQTINLSGTASYIRDSENKPIEGNKISQLKVA